MSSETKQKRRPVIVQMESPNLIPERDLGQIPVLEAKHIGIDFGGLTAVDDFNIAMGRTEISGLIGPNGAGKTTIFNLLTNVYKPTRGTILVDGYDTAGMSITQVNKLGIARTFQNIRLFSQMTVAQNILVGFGNSMSTHLVTDMLRFPKHWKQERSTETRRWTFSASSTCSASRTRRRATSVRRPAQARDSACARDASSGAAPRRARRGHEPERDRGADG